MATQVFISHHSEDADFARRLSQDLDSLSVPVWMAPGSIRPGEDWVEAISRGLAESSHLLVVLTPAAVASRWVRTETNVAIRREHQGEMEVIPLDVVPCEPPLLWTSYQMVSFRSGYDAGFCRLENMLTGDSAFEPASPVERPLEVAPPQDTRAARPTIMAQFRVLLADITDADPVTVRPHSHLAVDLKLDELDQIELLMAVEEEWGVEIADEDGANLATVADWVTYLSLHAGH